MNSFSTPTRLRTTKLFKVLHDMIKIYYMLSTSLSFARFDNDRTRIRSAMQPVPMRWWPARPAAATVPARTRQTMDALPRFVVEQLDLSALSNCINIDYFADVLRSSEEEGAAASDTSCEDHRRHCEVKFFSILLRSSRNCCDSSRSSTLFN